MHHTDLPFPETLPALGIQIALLRAGRKRLVLLPHGIYPEGVLQGLHQRETTAGLFVAADESELMNLPYAIEHDLVGLLLGYGMPTKPQQPDRGVTLRDPEGREVLTVTTDAAGEPAAREALERMALAGMTVERTYLTAILRDRAMWWLHFFDAIQPAIKETAS